MALTDLEYVRSIIDDPSEGGVYTDDELQEIINRAANINKAIGTALLGIANSKAKLARKKQIGGLTKDDTSIAAELRAQAREFMSMDSSGGCVTLERE